MAGRPRKLGPDEQSRILQLRDQHGMTLAAIAKEYSVGIATVSRICSLGSGAQTAFRSATDLPGSSGGHDVGDARHDSGLRGSKPAASESGTSTAKTGDLGTADQTARPVLSLHHRTPDQRPPDENDRQNGDPQDGDLRVDARRRSPGATHQAELGPGPESTPPVPSRGTTSPAKTSPTPETSGTDRPTKTGAADGQTCASREITDTSAAVAEALERWRQTRAQEDYVRVDKALADIRRALAKAEVELWTWQ